VIPIRRLFCITLTLLACSTLGAPFAHAQAVAKSDPRALALGGGYVAVADGWAALQWNPAGLWVSGRREVALTVGALPLEGGAWVESLRVVRGFSEALAPAEAAVTLASESAGLAGERVFGVYIVSKRFGGAIQELTYADDVSRARDGRVEIDAASLRTREFQASAAHPLMQGRLVIGGSAKLVQALGRMQSIVLDSLGASALTAGDLLGMARRGPVVVDDTVFAVDVGVLFMASARFRVGGVVKNLNAPGLESSEEGFTRLPRQIRVGGMAQPHPNVKVTADLDLSTDVFVEGGRKRRELGGGIEWAGAGVAIRGGLLFDLEAISKRPLYTFGFGLRGEMLRADFGAAWAPDRDGFGWLGALAAEF